MRLLLPALALLLMVANEALGQSVRLATFNSALTKDQPGELLATMQTPDDPQAKAVAAVIQAAKPDVLLLQEFDHGPGYDPDGQALRLFQQNYLAVPQQDGLEPITYEHVYLAPSNTGIPTGVDLDGDGLVAPTEGAEVGTAAYAADCHGYGLFPGQYAFVILSKYPIDRPRGHKYESLVWARLPGADLPDGYYSDEAKAVLRLSSKNHIRAPIRISDDTTIQLMAAHPTPPVFDGPEDRNGIRNAEEIRFLSLMAFGLAEKLELAARSGRNTILCGMPMTQRPLVVMGDLNADPNDGDSRKGVIRELFRTDPINADVVPTSKGGIAAARRQGGVNADHKTNPATDTADWSDQGRNASGNLRVDYVLPSRDLEVTGSGVFWPTPEEPLMGVDLATVERASDHRLVWVDVEVD